MYLPAHFNEDRLGVLHELIERHPLASIVGMVDGEIAANHVPLLLDRGRGEFGVLKGHVARANPMWRSLASGGGLLVIFQGPQAYVSPNWYAGKAEHGKVVPTWNYAVVHARGQGRAIEDRAWLTQLLTDLTDIHEARQASPWRVDDAPADYLDTMLEAIVGFEIPITRLSGKWKVSQNRSVDDRQGVVAGLRQAGDAPSADMAALVAGTLD
jgi:transcriptional regulator